MRPRGGKQGPFCQFKDSLTLEIPDYKTPRVKLTYNVREKRLFN